VSRENNRRRTSGFFVNRYKLNQTKYIGSQPRRLRINGDVGRCAKLTMCGVNTAGMCMRNFNGHKDREHEAYQHNQNGFDFWVQGVETDAPSK
jgi:hypothetical protein